MWKAYLDFERRVISVWICVRNIVLFDIIAQILLDNCAFGYHENSSCVSRVWILKYLVDVVRLLLTLSAVFYSFSSGLAEK